MINDGLQEKLHGIDSFLMIGQSNMAGRGELDGQPGIKNPLCFMQRNGRWQPMSEPINVDRPIYEGKYRSGANLCASFADLYAKKHGRRVGLIPCADGGTMIAQWQPGEPLFDHAVFCAQLAMRDSNLKAILLHQGESDCRATPPQLYAEQLACTVEGIRRALGLASLPCIAGEISEEILSDAWKVKHEEAVAFNARLHALTDTIPHFYVASAKGLALKPDGIHFSTPSLRTLGERYFEVYENL